MSKNKKHITVSPEIYQKIEERKRPGQSLNGVLIELFEFVEETEQEKGIVPYFLKKRTE